MKDLPNVVAARQFHRWRIMTNLIISTESRNEKNLSKTIGSLETFTSQKLLAEIKGSADELRREWMLDLFNVAGTVHSNNVGD